MHVDDLGRTSILCVVGLAVLLAAPWASVASAGEEDAAGPDEVLLPQTIEKVWYRAGQKKGLAGLRVFKAAGDLTVSREGLEFHGGKDAFSVPLANIKMVSMGKLGRDVDTDWAVLSLREGGLERLIAFKDGKALGYGQNTPLIYRTLRGAMRQLGGAQFSAPAGYRPYVAFDYQLALIVPDGWSVQVPAAVSVGDRTPWGTHIFSSRELPGGRELLDDQAVRQRAVDPAGHEYFLLREEVGSGMACSGFKPRALAVLLERAAGDPLFGGAFTMTEPPRSTPITIAGCEGLRVLAPGRSDEGAEVVLDLRAVAHHDTLFTFGVRTLASEHERLLAVFQPVVQAVRFAGAVD